MGDRTRTVTRTVGLLEKCIKMIGLYVGYYWLVDFDAVILMVSHSPFFLFFYFSIN